MKVAYIRRYDYGRGSHVLYVTFRTTMDVGRCSNIEVNYEERTNDHYITVCQGFREFR